MKKRRLVLPPVDIYGRLSALRFGSYIGYPLGKCRHRLHQLSLVCKYSNRIHEAGPALRTGTACCLWNQKIYPGSVGTGLSGRHPGSPAERCPLRGGSMLRNGDIQSESSHSTQQE